MTEQTESSMQQTLVTKEWTPLSPEQVAEIVATQTGFKLSEKQLLSLVNTNVFHTYAGSTLTVCVLFLNSGATVIGKSACIDPANYNEELGKTLAYRNAVQKLYELEGYTAMVIRALDAQHQAMAEEAFAATNPKPE